MTQFQVCTNILTAQIQIAVFHAQVVTAISVRFDGKWWNKRFVENRHFADNNFDIASWYFFVLGVALINGNCYLNDIFASQFVSLCTEFRICFFVEYELCYAIAVTQID